MSIRARILDRWASLRVAYLTPRAHPNLWAVVAPFSLASKHSLPINCVVFSKDRAMQLDACLRSIAAFAPYEGRISVIFKATTTEFGQAYRLLSLPNGVTLVEQGDDFKRDVLAAIEEDIEHTVSHRRRRLLSHPPRHSCRTCRRCGLQPPPWPQHNVLLHVASRSTESGPS